MNVYFFEVKSLSKACLIWTASIIMVFYTFLLFVYPIFEDGIEIMEVMFANMPAEFMQAFGLEVSSLLSYSGFYAFAFLYYSLMGAIMATNLSLAAFAREKSNKCEEFLFVKPMNRSHLFWAKLASVATCVLFCSVCYFLASIRGFAEHGGLSKMGILVSISLGLQQIIFLCIGMLVGVCKQKIRFISGLAATIGFTSFLVQTIVNLFEEDLFTYLSPFHYFAPSLVLEQNGYGVGYVVIALCMVLGSILFSYHRYTNADISMGN